MDSVSTALNLAFMSSLAGTRALEGVIITGGKGTRMRNITYVLPKPLLPLFSFNSDGRRYVKPFIDFILERFEALGLDPVTLVFSRNSSLIIDYLGNRGPLRLRLRLVLDAEMRGYGNAALLARSSVTGPFVLNADDNILPLEDYRAGVELFEAERPDAVLFVHRVEDPTRYGVIAPSSQGEFRGYRTYGVRGVVEKPSKPPSDLAMAAIYVMSPRVFRALEEVKALKGEGEEIELVEGLQRLIEEGGNVMALELRRRWVSVGRPEDYLEAIRLSYEAGL
ncbi:MAG: NTP transferase domain-containing protein [Acidilobus sp.]|nr:NTP transferase domain-containing protein [Acidilobus sp.]